MKEIQSDADVFFIKLGSSGRFTKDCIENNYARLGFDHLPHELCANGEWVDENGNKHQLNNKDKWEKVHQIQQEHSGTATQDKNAIQRFYEADEQTIWITFFGGKMYWTRLQPGVTKDESKKTYYKIRKCVDSWGKRSLSGESLDEFRISGKLLQVKNYRGTICEPAGDEIARCLIRDDIPGDIQTYEKVADELKDHLKTLIQDHLNPDNLELLVDLIFQSRGMKRQGVGGKREIVDLEVWNPLSHEVFFAQVKSKATESTLDKFLERIDAFESDKNYFIVSNPDQQLADRIEYNPLVENGNKTSVEIVGPDQLSEWAINTGLSSWIRDKAW